MNDELMQDKLSYHLMDSFVNQTPSVLSGHFFASAMSIALFWQQINSSFIAIWAVVMLIVLLSRVWMVSCYKRKLERWSTGKWRTMFALSSLSLGLTWCLWFLYVSLTINLTGIGLPIVVITSAGLVAGAVASTSSSLLSYFCFTLPAMIPLCALLFFNDQGGTHGTRGISWLMAIFFIFNWSQVRKLNEVLKESIINRLKLEKSQQQAEQLAQELYQLSTMDALTSVTNRRGFDEALGREWLRAKRLNTPLTLLMIDVDYFKTFNDSLGHLAGDDCLRLIASKLTQFARREGEVIARYGGEEFAILLPNMTGEEGVKIAKSISVGIAELDVKHPASGVSDRVTVSIGVYGAAPGQIDHSQELVKTADSALYEAKAAGRNCVRLANP